MRVLAIDPGAERCGWAVLDEGPEYVVSGIVRYPRNDMQFQRYRVELTFFFEDQFRGMLQRFEPDLAVNEIIPAVGGGNFTVATQSYLANCVVSAFQIAAADFGVPVGQIAARTVHKHIGITPRGAKKVTKQHVRNGVIHVFPELAERTKEWLKEFDEPDAIAIALTTLGCHT